MAGTSKPNPGIYEFAASQLGVQTSECLFIDDEAGHVLGACGAGMSTIRKAGPEKSGASQVLPLRFYLYTCKLWNLRETLDNCG